MWKKKKKGREKQYINNKTRKRGGELEDSAGVAYHLKSLDKPEL